MANYGRFNKNITCIRGDIMGIVIAIGVEHKEMRSTIQWFESHKKQVYEIAFNEILEKKTIDGMMKKIYAENIVIDYLIIQAEEHVQNDKSVGTGHDYQSMLELLNRNILGFRRILDSLTPYMKENGEKRIALLTHKKYSISYTEDTDDFSGHMLGAAIHMLFKNYFNFLKDEGFTFRCIDMECEDGMKVGEYILSDFANVPKAPESHSDEKRMIMRNGFFQEIPW